MLIPNIFICKMSPILISPIQKSLFTLFQYRIDHVHSVIGEFKQGQANCFTVYLGRSAIINDIFYLDIFAM